jgi:hypothetical protein
MRNYRAVALGILCLLAIIISIWAGYSFLAAATQPPGVMITCPDRDGIQQYQQDQAGFLPCIEERAKMFLDRDYAEAKDASKAFLTLLIAVFVASLTFSEKIVDVQRSGWWSRGLMITCWVLLLVAIASCGAGLALMMTAAGYAAYTPQLSYWSLEGKAVYLYIVSGLAFGGSLVALLIAGIISLVEQRPRRDAVAP